jgi:phosphomannomutase
VGHSIIKQVMADTGAVFGGEHSGHYYYRDNYRADSGIITALVVLELMSKSEHPLSEMLGPYKRYADSGEINTEVVDPAATVDAIAEHERAVGASIDRLDGLTVEHEDWWYNVRPSNTEPLLRLNVEARTPELCAAHVEGVRALIAVYADPGTDFDPDSADDPEELHEP